MKLTDEHKLHIEFSIGCAYRVLPKFESKYKNDARPRKALITAWNFLVNPTAKNKNAADYAAYATAEATANAAYATYTAYAADYAAGAAANAAYAANAAGAYADAAANAAGAAANAAGAALHLINAERKWQTGFLLALNIKYKLSVKIRGVE